MRLVLKKNKLTIGTNFAIGETRFRLPLHLLRFTVRSSSRAAQNTCTGSSAQSFGSWLYAAWPPRRVYASSRRRTSNDTPTGDAVEPRRFELLTFSLQRRRSTS